MILFICPSKRLLCPYSIIHRKRQSKGSRVRCSPSHRPVQLQLDPDVTSVMVPHASPTVVPLPVLRPDWKTLARLASSWSRPLDLNVCPASSFLHRFCGTTDKSKPVWFWGSNQETTAVILRPKSPNQSCQFWGSNRETRRRRFWGQNRENHRPWFWGSTKKLTLLISMYMVQTAHDITRPLDRPTIKYPTCATIFGPLHQVSYSCRNPHRCMPCHTCHLYTTR
jgi:hypothetical protein